MSNTNQPNSLTTTPTMSLRTACLILSALVLVAYPLVGWLFVRQYGEFAWTSVAIAAGVCWASATVALVMAGMVRDPSNAVSLMLLGMLVRMGVPLGAGTLVTQQGGPLAEAGFFGQIMAFYLVTLVSETVLSLKLSPLPSKAPLSNVTKSSDSVVDPSKMQLSSAGKRGA